MKSFLLAAVLSLITMTSANALTEHEICVVIAETAYQAQTQQRAGYTLDEVIENVQSNRNEENLELIGMVITVTQGVYETYRQDAPEMLVAIDAYTKCMEAP